MVKEKKIFKDGSLFIIYLLSIYVKITHLFVICLASEDPDLKKKTAFTQLYDFRANFLVLRRIFLKTIQHIFKNFYYLFLKEKFDSLNKFNLQDTGLEISKVNKTRALFLFVTLIKYTFKSLFIFFPLLGFL